VQAALGARGGRVEVVDAGEPDDDGVGDMSGVLTWMCSRWYGRRGAGNRVVRAERASRYLAPVQGRG
jgi:putative resolvase